MATPPVDSKMEMDAGQGDTLQHIEIEDTNSMGVVKDDEGQDRDRLLAEMLSTIDEWDPIVSVGAQGNH